MTFLYPTFLWALGVLSIPVIIHLFNFRRTTKVFFSNNRFLKQVKESTTAKRKLKHYLILASRLLFLFFLVMAFAQPLLPAREELVNHQNIVFYLDNSQSMSAPLEDRTRAMDAGTSFITNIINAFPVDSRYRLITNDFAPFSNSYKTKAEVQDLLSQIRLSPVSRSIGEIKERMLRQDLGREQEVFWISDFQRSTAGRSLPSRADSLFNWHLVPVALDELPNVFVDTAFLDNPFASSGEKNILRIKVRNDGKQNVDQLSVKLAINGIQAGATSVDVPAGGINEAAFDLTTKLTGLNRASLTFNDYPVSFDNEFFFTLNFGDKIRIVEIKQANNVSPIERVYGNEEIFAYRGYLISNFNYSLLDEADLVVVNGLNAIDISLNNALQDYLRKGGTVFLIPGKEPDVASLRNFVQLPQFQRVEGSAMQELDKPDFGNPFFENVFEEKSTSLIMPKATPLVDWGIDRGAILRFKNDKPFLSRSSRSGNLYLTTSPLENGYTDFFNHALFVPVMYRIAAGSKKNEQKLYYTLNESFLTVRFDSVRPDNQVRLVSEEEIIPSQRQVGQQVMLDLPKFTLRTGFYKVVSGSDTIDLLAFNSDKTESVMTQLSDQEARSYFGNGENVSIFDATDADALGKEIKERYLGTPLWKYAIILALLFLLTEVLLIRFWK